MEEDKSDFGKKMTRADRGIERGKLKNKGLCEDFHLDKLDFLKPEK